jgi:alcohol dehydrogenase class IV
MKDVFNLAPMPVLHFGQGKISVLPAAIKTYGSRFLLVSGARSLVASTHFEKLLKEFDAAKLTFEHFIVRSEPTPWIVDEGVQSVLRFSPDVVVAIGGGSVLDAAKAISAMIPLNEPVKNYLEGVGTKPMHPGLKVPFIAVPTTAGTGSEAARNAVLSETGPNGYKRSLRHNNFVSNIAIVDPILSLSCPPFTTAASGMDAFTQLLESYLSVAGNSITDALAGEGLRHVAPSLLTAFKDPENLVARTGMALGAYLSGVTLTNAGLGLVHGFASSIGGFYPIAHGVICSSLIAAANKLTVRKLRTIDDGKSLNKYANVGKILATQEGHGRDYYIDLLLSTLEAWAAEMNIPKLSPGGVSSKDFERIVNATENKNNPVALTSEEMLEVLEMAT